MREQAGLTRGREGNLETVAVDHEDDAKVGLGHLNDPGAVDVDGSIDCCGNNK